MCPHTGAGHHGCLRYIKDVTVEKLLEILVKEVSVVTIGPPGGWEKFGYSVGFWVNDVERNIYGPTLLGDMWDEL